MNADKKCALGVDSSYVELAVEVFSMLADATRVRIILALRDEELSVNHLADVVEKSPAAISQHRRVHPTPAQIRDAPGA